ncbi:MAG: DUF4388 domain-containing protein [Actinobacteria bacterium]|nr:DUF4388 domain-containing protein [Actinomycetota bacterium]
MVGQMHLSGQLTDWSIHDLLQIMQVTRKTGSLDIEGERRGRIHFRNGGVSGAELTGANGTYAGSDRGSIADILYVLSTLTEGAFSVGPADGPDIVGWGVEEVLADVEALRHLEGEVIDAGLFEAGAVRLVTDVAESVTVDPHDWAALAALIQPFTFAELEAQMGRGGAVRVFHTLHRLGVAEPVPGVEDDESVWLDQVADGLAPEADESTWLEQKTAEPTPEPVAAAVEPKGHAEHERVLGVSAPASTTLTDGVYDEIRRLRSKVADR